MNEKHVDRSGCLSFLLVDRWVAGDVSEAERRAVTDHAAICSRCHARLDDVRGAQRAFREHAPALQLPRVPKQTPRARPGLAIGIGVAVAASAGLLLFRPPAQFVSVEANGNAERSKGSNSPFGYYVLRDGQLFEGRPDRPLYPGDAIQATLSPPGAGYFALLSVDGAGNANIYYPNGPTATALPARPGQLLPQSTVLDDVLGEETLYALFCQAPIELSALRTRLAAGGGLSAPDGCMVHTSTFRKVKP